MFGSFSEEALAEYSEMVAQTQSADFSEGDTYDFTRCMRPNGSIYGTRGQCRKGVESTKGAAAKVAERAAKLARQKKNQTPERKAMYDQLAANAAGRARDPLKKGDARGNMTPGERERRREADAYESSLYGHKNNTYGRGGVTKDARKMRKQEALGEFAKAGLPSRVDDAIERVMKHPKLQKYVDKNASYDDLAAKVPKRVLKKVLGWTDKDVEAINRGTDAYEGGIYDNGDGNYHFYGAA